MAEVDWKCLTVHAAVTVLTFFVVNNFFLYKKDENKVQPDIKVNDLSLYGSLILSFLVGYLVIIFMKMDCINYPDDNDETTIKNNKNKENYTQEYCDVVKPGSVLTHTMWGSMCLPPKR